MGTSLSQYLSRFNRRRSYLFCINLLRKSIFNCFSDYRYRRVSRAREQIGADFLRKIKFSSLLKTLDDSHFQPESVNIRWCASEFWFIHCRDKQHFRYPEDVVLAKFLRFLFFSSSLRRLYFIHNSSLPPPVIRNYSLLINHSDTITSSVIMLTRCTHSAKISSRGSILHCQDLILAYLWWEMCASQNRSYHISLQQLKLFSISCSHSLILTGLLLLPKAHHLFMPTHFRWQNPTTRAATSLWTLLTTTRILPRLLSLSSLLRFCEFQDYFPVFQLRNTLSHISQSFSMPAYLFPHPIYHPIYPIRTPINAQYSARPTLHLLSLQQILTICRVQIISTTKPSSFQRRI